MTMVVTSEVFLPVFYRLGITSTYEVSLVLELASSLLLYLLAKPFNKCPVRFFLCHGSAKYLELRFNRATRLLGTVLFIVQTVSKKPVKP